MRVVLVSAVTIFFSTAFAQHVNHLRAEDGEGKAALIQAVRPALQTTKSQEATE